MDSAALAVFNVHDRNLDCREVFYINHTLSDRDRIADENIWYLCL